MPLPINVLLIMGIIVLMEAMGAEVSALNIHAKTSIFRCSSTFRARRMHTFPLLDRKDESESNGLDGVIELVDDVPVSVAAVSAPFLSQGEIDPEALNPDLSDPKQARVIIYIILSLLPVLFLIPLMLGSRELIPLEDLPPVQL